MDLTPVVLQPNSASSLEIPLKKTEEALRLQTVPVIPHGKVVAHQTLDENAWSLSDGKRLFDFVAATIGFILFFPLMVLISIAIATTSPGPILFRQKRMGKRGMLFTIYKFRTMVDGAENGPCITVQGDSRITRVGALLRKFKLDELPQLINVIKGDMSFIGPRPKLPHHESLHMPFRPGITGAATLAFRCEEELLRRVPAGDLDFFYARTVKPLKAKLDWEYMQRATWWSDFGLLWCTLTACLSRQSTPVPVIEFPGAD
jgi:lipopolysaccharide/colanic/teichoic acid biosynthesis glycosyltransferase